MSVRGRDQVPASKGCAGLFETDKEVHRRLDEKKREGRGNYNKQNNEE